MNIDPTNLGYVAAFCTTCSFIPQVLQTLKTKDTEAISLGMYSFFVFGVGLWLIYGFLVQDLPIILANAVTLTLASVILFLKIKSTLLKRKTAQESH
ncbi:SemiSWEET transporter [Vibrio sp. JC009]|uniref:SemiSWEET transporter n=1 Tax=Vibrio sp. JC009 TaxID=2912314 RepID=UPI0023B07EB4|nr:SemiSWEET transporter [Vibrio sp. JC009]WED22665.1 SemiSWEET transporter [Vibrio sp. JC009]